MFRRLRLVAIKAALVVMGISSSAYAQSSPSGPQFCPPIEAFLTPTLLDLVFPGLSTDP